MTDMIERMLRHFFPILDESDIRRFAKLIGRALIKKGQSLWKWNE